MTRDREGVADACVWVSVWELGNFGLKKGKRSFSSDPSKHTNLIQTHYILQRLRKLPQSKVFSGRFSKPPPKNPPLNTSLFVVIFVMQKEEWNCIFGIMSVFVMSLVSFYIKIMPGENQCQGTSWNQNWLNLIWSPKLDVVFNRRSHDANWSL